MIMERLVQIIITVVIMVGLAVGYLALVERILKRSPNRRQQALRPWLWLAPALVFLAVFLVYPIVNTLLISLMNANSTGFTGLGNYVFVFTNPGMQAAIGNNLLWLIVFVPVTVVLGLLMAVLTDRVRYERVARAIMFLPMAISFVAAGVIWKFMFDYRPAAIEQTGTLNALWLGINPSAEPQAWLIQSPGNNIALILVAAWMFVGFCMVILAAGLKSIPGELLEAARVDGASERRIFFRITIPLLSPTLAVVTTTMVIAALKAFDIVYVLTNGNYGTDVIATRMYKELFSARHFGHASAIAVLLLIVTIPIMLLNIRSFRQQETNS
jgi:alpha-glucoside transport system permease protein